MILPPTQLGLLGCARDAAIAAGRYASAWNLYCAATRGGQEAPVRVVVELNAASEDLADAMDVLRAQQATHLRAMAAVAREALPEDEAPEDNVVTLRAAS